MPYIKPELRAQFAPAFLNQPVPQTAGELNYLITKIVTRYYSDHGGGYARGNDIIGALEGVKLEFYRRLLSAYEDQKIKENGDVY